MGDIKIGENTVSQPWKEAMLVGKRSEDWEAGVLHCSADTSTTCELR